MLILEYALKVGPNCLALARNSDKLLTNEFGSLPCLVYPLREQN
jgi:hypothetical protein